MAKELQQRQNEIEEQIQSCKAKEERRNKRKHLTVTENSVADIVSDWTKIPVKKLTDGETKRLAALEKELHKRVIGQDEAVKAVAQAVQPRKSRSERPTPSDWFISVPRTNGCR